MEIIPPTSNVAQPLRPEVNIADRAQVAYRVMEEEGAQGDQAVVGQGDLADAQMGGEEGTHVVVVVVDLVDDAAEGGDVEGEDGEAVLGEVDLGDLEHQLPFETLADVVGVLEQQGELDVGLDADEFGLDGEGDDLVGLAVVEPAQSEGAVVGPGALGPVPPEAEQAGLFGDVALVEGPVVVLAAKGQGPVVAFDQVQQGFEVFLAQGRSSGRSDGRRQAISSKTSRLQIARKLPTA